MPTVYYSLGNLYWNQQEYQQAVYYFQQITTYHPDSFMASMAQTNLGLCYTDIRDYKSAIASYRTLLKNFSHPPSVKENINKLIKRLQSDSEDKLQISAWVAHVDKKKQQAKYEGNVNITFSNTVITARKAIVYLQDNTALIEGKIRLEWKTLLVVTAEKMTVNFVEKTVSAIGNVDIQRHVGEKIYEESWSAIELSLTNGSSIGKSTQKNRR